VEREFLKDGEIRAGNSEIKCTIAHCCKKGLETKMYRLDSTIKVEQTPAVKRTSLSCNNFLHHSLYIKNQYKIK